MGRHGVSSLGGEKTDLPLQSYSLTKDEQQEEEEEEEDRIERCSEDSFARSDRPVSSTENDTTNTLSYVRLQPKSEFALLPLQFSSIFSN